MAGYIRSEQTQSLINGLKKQQERELRSIMIKTAAVTYVCTIGLVVVSVWLDKKLGFSEGDLK
jgi:hypothetical protein